MPDAFHEDDAESEEGSPFPLQSQRKAPTATKQTNKQSNK